MYLALFTAFDLTSVAVGTVLLYLAPALVTVGAALLLNEPLTRRKLIALIATFGGCLLVVELYQPQDLVGNALGIGWGLVAAAAYAAYSLGAKPLLARYRAVTVLAYALLPAAVGLLAVKLLTAPDAWPSPGGLLAIGAYGGIVVTIAPYGLYMLALRRLPSSEASIVATLEPAVAVVLAGALLGERLAPLQLLGTIGILGGVVLLAWPAAAPPKRHPRCAPCWSRSPEWSPGGATASPPCSAADRRDTTMQTTTIFSANRRRDRGCAVDTVALDGERGGVA